MDRLKKWAKKLAKARRRRIGEARAVFPNSPKDFDGIPMPQREYEKKLFEMGFRPARKRCVVTKYPNGESFLGSITDRLFYWED